MCSGLCNCNYFLNLHSELTWGVLNLLIFVPNPGALTAFLIALQWKHSHLHSAKQPKFTETCTALPHTVKRHDYLKEIILMSLFQFFDLSKFTLLFIAVLFRVSLFIDLLYL